MQAATSTLLNPDAIETHIASCEVSESRKEKICVDLDRFYKFKGIPFQTPRYHRIEAQSMAFLRIPGYERLNSGVEISKAFWIVSLTS